LKNGGGKRVIRPPMENRMAADRERIGMEWPECSIVER
jgi:hypothetical protein